VLAGDCSATRSAAFEAFGFLANDLGEVTEADGRCQVTDARLGGAERSSPVITIESLVGERRVT